MKAVLISIQPKWCELIASGKKTIEVRKTAPKFDKPFKVYIYETKDKKYDGIGVHWENGRDFIHNGGKVIGEFICDDLLAIENLKSSFRVKEDREGEGRLTNMTATASCMWFSDMKAYLGDKDGWGWGISELKIYDKPRLLSEFQKCGALTAKELDDEICNYCLNTSRGTKAGYGTPNGYVGCEGRWCE